MAEKKYYVPFATNEEGARLYRESPEELRTGTHLGTMKVEGKTVPAIYKETTREEYLVYKREQWKEEDRLRQEGRCMVSGKDGKLIRCPMRIPNPDYTGKPGELKTLPVKCEECPYQDSKHGVFVPTSITDGDNNPYAHDAAVNYNASGGDELEIMAGFLDFIRKNYPEHARKAELCFGIWYGYDREELMEEYQIGTTTVYQWRNEMRPYFDEFLNQTDRP